MLILGFGADFLSDHVEFLQQILLRDQRSPGRFWTIFWYKNTLVMVGVSVVSQLEVGDPILIGKATQREKDSQLLCPVLATGTPPRLLDQNSI